MTDHISDKIINLYSRREANAADILRIQNHLAACADCRRKLALVTDAESKFAAVRETFAFDDAPDETEHLTYEQLEFFLDHKLDEVDREIVESHVSFCDECRRDLDDLLKFRKIALTASPIKNETIIETPKNSIWKLLFSFASGGSFAPIAAVLLIAILAGVWFLLRPVGTNDIARIDKNQNSAGVNLNAAINDSTNGNSTGNTAPENPPSNSSEKIPVPKNETLYALNDGSLNIDGKGNLRGAENLSPATRDLIRQALRNGNISVRNNSLGDTNGVLMGENNAADGGVPFALSAPTGKIVRNAQPVLSWKPLKDATTYSVIIVDEKFRIVAESGKIAATNWKPSKPLPRGAIYSWQVTAALPDGSETVSPAAPAPQARFRVLEQNLNNEISRLEKSKSPSHLALGLLYAKAGLKREARAELAKLVRKNPRSDTARKLLRSLR